MALDRIFFPRIVSDASNHATSGKAGIAVAFSDISYDIVYCDRLLWADGTISAATAECAGAFLGMCLIRRQFLDRRLTVFWEPLELPLRGRIFVGTDSRTVWRIMQQGCHCPGAPWLQPMILLLRAESTRLARRGWVVQWEWLPRSHTLMKKVDKMAKEAATLPPVMSWTLDTCGLQAELDRLRESLHTSSILFLTNPTTALYSSPFS